MTANPTGPAGPSAPDPSGELSGATGSGPAAGGRAAGRVGRVLLAAVRFYQRAISPALPPRCRFHPTCSAYAAAAITVHGARRGSWLAVRRLLRCAPWHPGGVDPVPPARVTVARTDRAAPPASRRTPPEESSVA